jgi:hypothetical protein
MVRRFACLLPVGLLNLLFLFDGDILTMYSVFALVLLVPAMFLPRGLLLTVGLASTVAAYWVFGNSPMIAATLMVTGFAAAQFGLPAWLESQSGQDHGVAFSVFGVFGLSAIGGGGVRRPSAGTCWSPARRRTRPPMTGSRGSPAFSSLLPWSVGCPWCGARWRGASSSTGSSLRWDAPP